MDISNYLNNTITFLPFIIVVCFILYSIISTDVKSIIFLSGLLITVFLTKITFPHNDDGIKVSSGSGSGTGTGLKGLFYDIARYLNLTAPAPDATTPAPATDPDATAPATSGTKCKLLFLDKDGSENPKPLSTKPLCIVTIWYLLSYILTIIGRENIWLENLPLVIILGSIAVCYTIWLTFLSDCMKHFSNKDNDNFGITFIALFLGSIGGFLWATYIDLMEITELKYFAGLSTKEKCSRPKRTLYKCEFKNPI